MWSDFGDTTLNNSEVTEYFLQYLFSVLHFIDGPLCPRLTDHTDQS